MAKILDGKELSAQLRAELTLEVNALKEKGIYPGLALIIVGKVVNSHNFVRNKHRACVAVGIHSVLHKLPSEATEQELLALIKRLNADPSIHGIHIQFPLPEHMDYGVINGYILPEKDVAGANPINVGKLCVGVPSYKPFIAAGIFTLIESYNIPIENKNCLIIGTISVTSRPLVMMLMERKGVVTVCHPDAPQLKDYLVKADIVITAAQLPRFISGDDVKEGVAVIDTGNTTLPDGTRCGDVDFDSVFKKASYINPVPGNVGPITATMLLRNTIDAAARTMPPEQNIIDNNLE